MNRFAIECRFEQGEFLCQQKLLEFSMRFWHCRLLSARSWLKEFSLALENSQTRRGSSVGLRRANRASTPWNAARIRPSLEKRRLPALDKGIHETQILDRR